MLNVKMMIMDKDEIIDHGKKKKISAFDKISYFMAGVNFTLGVLDFVLWGGAMCGIWCMLGIVFVILPD